MLLNKLLSFVYSFRNRTVLADVLILLMYADRKLLSDFLYYSAVCAVDIYLTTNLSAKYYSSKEVTCVPYLTDNVGVTLDVANCQA